MERFHLKNENQKNNHQDFFKCPKKQSSFKNLILASNRKNIQLFKYLQYKQERENTKKKSNSKENSTTSYVKATNLPSINANNATNGIKKPLETMSNYTNVRDLKNTNSKEKEDIISQLLHEKDELDIKNRELMLLRNYYQKLQENNLTYKVIIEKILKIDNGTEIDNANIDSFKNKKGFNSPRAVGLRKIYDLKKQLLNFDKTIDEKNKLLEETKKEKKTKNFINLNKLLIEKNYELENLVLNSKELQYFHNDMDNRVDFLNHSIVKFKENIVNLKNKLKKNKQEIKDIEKEIQNSIKEKEDIQINIETLEKDVKIIEEHKNKNKEIIQQLKTEYENNQEIDKEKQIINNNLEEYIKLENNIVYILEKNSRKINLLQNENKDFQTDIEKIKKEKKNLKDNIKENHKNKQILKNYKKKIKELKEEIEKNKEDEKLLILKREKENERIKKEIEEFEKAKLNLLKKIEELNKELNLKIKLNNKKEEELNQKNQEYVDIKKCMNN